jgi:hypothetical protein
MHENRKTATKVCGKQRFRDKRQPECDTHFDAYDSRWLILPTFPKYLFRSPTSSLTAAYLSCNHL